MCLRVSPRLISLAFQLALLGCEHASRRARRNRPGITRDDALLGEGIQQPSFFGEIAVLVKAYARLVCVVVTLLVPEETHPARSTLNGLMMRRMADSTEHP